jgi:hypothetical protein
VFAEIMVSSKYQYSHCLERFPLASSYLLMFLSIVLQEQSSRDWTASRILHGTSGQ